MFEDISIKLVETDEDLLDALLLKRMDDSETLGCTIYDIPSPDIFNIDVKNETNNFLIAKKGNKPVGYASGRVASKSPNTYWSEGIYVIPEFRNNGIGFALKQKQIEFAKNTGFTSLCSNVLKTNKHSIKIQEKVGCSFESKGDCYKVILYLQDKSTTPP